MTNRPSMLALVTPADDSASRAALLQSATALGMPIALTDSGSGTGPENAERDGGCGSRETRRRGSAVLAAARKAAALEMTHVLTLDPAVSISAACLNALLSDVAAAPRALIVGTRGRAPWRKAPGARLGRALSGALFRVQTGQWLADVACGFRVYPVAVLQGLRFCSRGPSFEKEVLVRAAWAGVELRSLPTPCDDGAAQRQPSRRRALLDRIVLVALNIHLAMRSVVPWPHRRIESASGPRVRITILHPLRSLRRLVMENTSPREIALAVGLGVLLGALPLLFVHTVAILFAAAFCGVNKPSAVVASQLCMPPLVPALCVEVGHFMRHGRFLTEVSIRTLGYEVGDRFLEWVLGSLVLAPLLAVMVAAIAYGVAVAIRRQLDHEQLL